MKKSVAVLVALFTMMLASPAGAQDDATIMLAHGIPDTDVDVVVDGSAVIEGLSFGDMEDLSSFAGQTLAGLTVNLAGTDTVAIDLGDFDVPASGNFTVIAHLDADANPTAAVFENDTSAIAAGEGRLVVRHTAAAPAVDILANGDAAFTNVTNGQEAQADLPAGTISAEVVPTGATEPVVIGPADLPITEGESLIVYAVGSLDADSLSVLTQSIAGLGSSPTVVNTGNSPVDDSGVNTLAITAVAVIALLGLGIGTRRLATVKA
ncbi:MAG: DUF4397 domain-containing protein [Acidimicrobiales bacterium]